MKIVLDEDNSIEVKSDVNNKLNLIFKTKQSSNKTVIITAKLDSKQLDQMITQMLSLKTKIR